MGQGMTKCFKVERPISQFRGVFRRRIARLLTASFFPMREFFLLSHDQASPFSPFYFSIGVKLENMLSRPHFRNNQLSIRIGKGRKAEIVFNTKLQMVSKIFSSFFKYYLSTCQHLSELLKEQQYDLGSNIF